MNKIFLLTVITFLISSCQENDKYRCEYLSIDGKIQRIFHTEKHPEGCGVKLISKSKEIFVSDFLICTKKSETK